MDITKEEFDVLLNESSLLVVDFHATWCAPCKAIGPVIKELSEEYKDRANIVKVDVDDQQLLASEYGIRSIPTILFFKGGELVEKKVGQPTKTELEDMIVSHL